MSRVTERLTLPGTVERLGTVGSDPKLFESRSDRDGMGAISGVNGSFEIVPVTSA